MTREARGAQLLACAVRLAAEEGLQALVHADVARAANVVVGTVFIYFPTRGDLLRAVVAEVSRYYLAQSAQFHRSDAAPEVALRAHGEAFVASLRTHPEYALVWLQWSASVNDEHGLWALFTAYNAALVEAISGTVLRAWPEGARDPAAAETLAHILISTAFTTTRLHFSGASEAAIQGVLDATMNIFPLQPGA